MDEPCSALDVEGTRAIEELMFEPRAANTRSSSSRTTWPRRAAPSDECIFMLLGEIDRALAAPRISFSIRRTRKTAEYIEGRYG